jgi:DNA-directed RNA polymerase subunit RPC12/RpoP
MIQCSKCGSDNVHRSRSKTAWELWRKTLTAKRPYRCSACGWREWMVVPAPPVADGRPADAVEPRPAPLLRDASAARRAGRRTEVDLTSLDRLGKRG